MAAFEAYLDEIARRLASSGFAVWRGVPLNPFVLDILAARRRLELSKFGEMSRVIAVAHPEPVSPYAVTSYSAWAAKYALGGRLRVASTRPGRLGPLRPGRPRGPLR